MDLSKDPFVGSEAQADLIESDNTNLPARINIAEAAMESNEATNSDGDLQNQIDTEKDTQVPATHRQVITDTEEEVAPTTPSTPRTNNSILPASSQLERSGANIFTEVPQGHLLKGVHGHGPVGVRGVVQCVGVYFEYKPGEWFCAHFHGWPIDSPTRESCAATEAEQDKIVGRVKKQITAVVGTATDMARDTLVVMPGGFLRRNERMMQSKAIAYGVWAWATDSEGGKVAMGHTLAEFCNGFIVMEPGSGSLESLKWLEDIDTNSEEKIIVVASFDAGRGTLWGYKEADHTIKDQRISPVPRERVAE